MEVLLQEYGTIVAFYIRLLACGLVLVFCIPLQIREAKVKNGLYKLRILLLAFGVITLISNISTMVILHNLVSAGIPQTTNNAFLQVFNALAYLALSIIGLLIYNQQYTDESKEFHARVHKLEQVEAAEQEKEEAGETHNLGVAKTQ